QSLRLRQIIDELVRQRVPSVSAATVPAPVVEYALRESLHGELIQEVLRRSAGDAAGDRAGGFMAKMDRMLGDVISKILSDLHVQGSSKTIREDLRKIDDGIEVQAKTFLTTAP